MDCGKKTRESEYKNSTLKRPRALKLNREHSCSEETVVITAKKKKKAFLLSHVLPITRTSWLASCLPLGSATGYICFGPGLFPLIHKWRTVKFWVFFFLVPFANDDLGYAVTSARILLGLKWRQHLSVVALALSLVARPLREEPRHVSGITGQNVSVLTRVTDLDEINWDWV